MGVDAKVYGRAGGSDHNRKREPWATMQEREVSIRSVLAAVLWVIGSAMVILSVFAMPGLGHVGLVFVAGGMVLHIRGFFLQFFAELKNAFELGRDYERGRDRVRNLR